jgi:hypothetical protein
MITGKNCYWLFVVEKQPITASASHDCRKELWDAIYDSASTVASWQLLTTAARIQTTATVSSFRAASSSIE